MALTFSTLPLPKPYSRPGQKEGDFTLLASKKTAVLTAISQTKKSACIS